MTKQFGWLQAPATNERHCRNAVAFASQPSGICRTSSVPTGHTIKKAHSERSLGAGEILAAVQIAMIAGRPYTALRDAVLRSPDLRRLRWDGAVLR